jgi:uncharacterized protein
MLGHPIYSPWKGVQNVDSAKPFIAALRERRFILQECADCGRTAGPGRLHCEYCRSARLVWRKADRTGRLLAVTEYEKQYDHEYERKVPYNVVLARLDNGVLLLGTIDAKVRQEHVGRRIRLDVTASGKGMPLKFAFDAEIGQ